MLTYAISCSLVHGVVEFDADVDNVLIGRPPIFMPPHVAFFCSLPMGAAVKISNTVWLQTLAGFCYGLCLPYRGLWKEQRLSLTTRGVYPP